MLHRVARVLAGLSIIICAAGPAIAAKVGAEFLINNKALNSSVAQPVGGAPERIPKRGGIESARRQPALHRLDVNVLPAV